MIRKTKTNNARSGSGLVFAVVLLFVILSMVVTLSSVTVLETKMSQKNKSSVGAFYNSESGVEWALNKIATGTGPNISNVFSGFSGGKITCPSGSSCDVYFLDENGKVITADALLENVKAVRSIGSQGNKTQRAIEAAVAAGGSGCFTFYCSLSGTENDCSDHGGTQKHCPTGWIEKIKLGAWGDCPGDYGGSGFRPPGTTCRNGGSVRGDAFVCCQN